MQDDNDVFDEVVGFIREEDTWPIRVITPSTRLEADLHITGDDAGPFMEAFCKRFGVSVTTLDLNRYFHSEGVVIPWLTPLLFRLFNGVPMPPPPSYDLTVGDLVRAARLKKWVDPI